MAPAVPPPALTAERAEKEGRRERRAGGGGDGRSAAAWGCGGRRACRVPMCVQGFKSRAKTFSGGAAKMMFSEL
jgi:hypothetical protein